MILALTIIGSIVVANAAVYALSLALQCYELGEYPEWSFVYWLMPEWTDALPFIPSVSCFWVNLPRDQAAHAGGSLNKWGP